MTTISRSGQAALRPTAVDVDVPTPVEPVAPQRFGYSTTESEDFGPAAINPATTGAAQPVAPVLTGAMTTAVNELTSTAGYALLTDAEKATLSRRMTNGSELGASLRQSMHWLVGSSDFAGKPAAQQAAEIRQVIAEERGLQQVVSQNLREPSARPYQISAATPAPNFAFDSKRADGQQYTVTVNGHAVNVVVASQNPGHQASIEQIAKGLASLPEQSLAVVRNVYVEPDYNPQDAHWAEVYHRPDFHSYMTAGSAGDVRVYPTSSATSQAVLDGSLIHETGHVLSKRAFGEDSNSGRQWRAWSAAAASDGLHVSHYATSSNDEDFAETLEQYQATRGTPQEAELRRLFPARYAILDRMVPPQ